MQDTLIKRRGLLFVLSSPSGAGKTSISKELLNRDSNLSLSVSVTSRAPRDGEIDGVDYIFVTEDKFMTMVEQECFIEYAKVFGNYYGTLKSSVEMAISEGQDVLFDIDWQGTQQLREHTNIDVASVFIMPPNIPELEKRLKGRAQDNDNIIFERMSQSVNEISHWPEYDYVIVNDTFEESVIKIQSILTAERLKRRRQMGLSDFVKSMLKDYE